MKRRGSWKQKMTAVLSLGLWLGSQLAIAAEPPAGPARLTDDRGTIYVREDKAAEEPGGKGPAVALLRGKAGLPENVPPFAFSERYSAQRKPRIAVYPFTDANSQARPPILSASVEAMLVTFLKRKSQFVVVERQKLGDVKAEWQLGRSGQTNMLPQDPAAKELFEKIDALIVGSVTVLNAPSTVKPVEVRPRTGAPRRPTPRGTTASASRSTSRRSGVPTAGSSPPPRAAVRWSPACAPSSSASEWPSRRSSCGRTTAACSSRCRIRTTCGSS